MQFVLNHTILAPRHSIRHFLCFPCHRLVYWAYFVLDWENILGGIFGCPGISGGFGVLGRCKHLFPLMTQLGISLGFWGWGFWALYLFPSWLHLLKINATACIYFTEPWWGPQTAKRELATGRKRQPRACKTVSSNSSQSVQLSSSILISDYCVKLFKF